MATTNPASLSGYIFTGFSTIGQKGADPKTLHDIQLIHENLKVRFSVMPGEQVMRPDRGCIIWYLLDEQMTSTNVQSIVNEATRICELDPRLAVQSMNINTLDSGIQIEITLNYIPYNSVGTFIMNFNTRQSSLMNTSTGTN